MIKLCKILHGSNFVRFSRVVVACCHVVGRLQATAAWSLKLRLVYSPLRRFHHQPLFSVGGLGLTPHQAHPLPLVHQTLSVSLLLLLYMLWYDSDYLLCRSLEETSWNTSIVYFWWFSSWCEDRQTHGKDLALVELGEERHTKSTTALLRLPKL